MPKVMKKKKRSAVDELTPLNPPKKESPVPLLSLSLSVSAMAAQMVDMANRIAELERVAVLHAQQLQQVVSSSNEAYKGLADQIAQLQQALVNLTPKAAQPTGTDHPMARPPGAMSGAAMGIAGAAAVGPATHPTQQTLRPVPQTQPGNNTNKVTTP